MCRERIDLLFLFLGYPQQTKSHTLVSIWNETNCTMFVLLFELHHYLWNSGKQTHFNFKTKRRRWKQHMHDWIENSGVAEGSDYMPQMESGALNWMKWNSCKMLSITSINGCISYIFQAINCIELIDQSVSCQSSPF